MKKTICYPVSSLDRKLAQTDQFRKAGYVPAMIANLRALYDSSHAFPFAPDHLDDETIIVDKLDTLDEFRKKLRDKDRSKISNTGTMYAEAFLELVRSNMPSENRRIAADVIAQEFSRIVSERASDTKKSKAEICKDEFSIFEEVYNAIDERTEDESLSDEEYDFLKDILDHFGAFSVYARVVLKNSENLILGSTKSYAATATDENWEEVVYEDFYNADEETKESWQEQANAKSAYSRVSEYVRHILSNVETGVTIAGYPVRYPGQQVHQHLANLLRGVSNSKRMMALLEIASEDGDAIAKAVLGKIKNEPLYQRCMYTSFKNGFTPYSETKSSDSKNSIFSLNKPIRNFYNNYIHDVTSGEVSAKSIFYKDINTGEILVDTEKLNALVRDADKFVFSSAGASMASAISNAIEEAKNRGIYKKRQVAALTNLVFNHAQAWGINVDASTITKLLSQARTRNALLKAFTSLYDEDGVPSLVASTESLGINLSAAALITKEVTVTKGSDNVAITTPVQKALSKIIDIFESATTDDRYPSTARAKSKKGKDTLIHSNHPACFMTDFFDPIITMAQEGDYQGIKDMLLQRYQDVSYFYDTKKGEFKIKWLQDLITANDKNKYTFADNLEHTRTVQHTTPTGNIISVENTTEQQKWNILATMYASTTGNAYDNAFAWYPVFVLGDSGSYRWIKAPKYSIKAIVDGMYQVFEQECLLKEEIDNINSTITTGSKIQFGTEDGSLAMLPFLKYSDKQTSTKEQIQDRIKEYFEKVVNERLVTLETQGLIAKDKEGNYVDKAHIVPKGHNLRDFVQGWVYNSEFATMNQFQLMTISPSFYKDSVDLQKRYKEIHASGSAMDVFGQMTAPSGETVSIFPPNVLTAEGAYETVAYFKDIEILPQEVHDYLLQIIGKENAKSSAKYQKPSTLTDGQGYRTLDSYRQIAMAQGRWNEKGPEEAVYKMIKELGREGLSEERKQELREKIAASKVVFQVEKPFLFTHEKLQTAAGSSVYIPVQHKCSEMVLIPELLPEGSNLRNLGLAMKAQGLDAVYSTTVVKVGMFGETDLAGLNGFDAINSALSTAKKHSLNLSNYYRQQNVPEHVNQSRQLGTQVMKMPFVDLDLTGNTVYDYYDPKRLAKAGGKIVLTDGRTIDNPKNGRGVARFYNALICSGIMEDLKKFLSEVGDTVGLGARMQQIVLSNSRNTIDSLFAYSMTNDNKFLVPLMELGVEHDAMSLLLSWFRKQVLHRTIAGGSAVQASAYGIAKIETDEVDAGKLEFRYTTDKDGKPSNITWMQAELTWDLTYTDISGNTKELDYYKYCNPDGTLKTNSKGEILLDIDYPGIRNIVAYRIPTENNYSVMNLEVIRFTLKTPGGVIKVPLEGTTIAGFDFDVDKLYLVRKEFKSKELKQDQIRQIWEQLYSDHRRDIMKPLLATRNNIENIQDDIDALMNLFFSNNGTAKAIVEGHGQPRKLYEYWEDAGLTEKTGMTYTEFFNSYYHDNKKEFGFEEFDTYDYSKPINKQSKVAKNNEILNIIQQRLMDPGTIKSRTTPGGFGTASRVGKEMRILESGDTALVDRFGNINNEVLQERLDSDNKYLEPRRATDLATWVAYSQQNQVAGALIGIFANHNTNNIYSKTAYQIGFTLAPFTINGKKYSDLIHSKTNTIQTLAELLAASVDAVKDPVLNYFNLNTHTANTAATLARLGYSLEEIGLFLNQPIIKELCDLLDNNSRETLATAALKIKNSYLHGTTAAQNENQATMFDVLRKNIFNYNKAKNSSIQDKAAFFAENGPNQLAILNMFTEAQAYVGELTGFINTTKFTASNAVGSTAGDIYESLYKSQKYTDKSADDRKLQVVIDPVRTKMSNLNTNLDILTGDAYLEQILDNPFAFEQCMYDAIKSAFIEMSKQYFAYETPVYKHNRDYLNAISRSQSLKADTINKIHTSIYQYLLENLEGSIFDPNTLLPDGTTRKKYYLEQYPADCRRTLAEEEKKAVENNTPLSRLGRFIKNHLSIYNNKSGALIINATGNMQMTVDQKNNFTEAWDMLYNGTTVEKQFAKDLFLYTYYKSGFKFGAEAFAHLIPNSIKSDIVIGNRQEYKDGKLVYRQITFADYLNDIQEGKVLANAKGTDFIRGFLLNNLDNSAFVANFYNSSDLTKQDGVVVSKEGIKIDVEKLSSNSLVAKKIVWGDLRYAPVIIHGNDVYMLHPTALAEQYIFTLTADKMLTYDKVGTLTENERAQIDQESSNNVEQDDITLTTSPSTPSAVRRTHQGLLDLLSSQFEDADAAKRAFTENSSAEIARLIQESMSSPKPVFDQDGNQFDEVC